VPETDGDLALREQRRLPAAEFADPQGNSGRFVALGIVLLTVVVAALVVRRRLK